MALDRKTLSLYALPGAGITAMQWLVMIYLLKFSTDTLGLEPAIVGTLFAAGRIWDGVSDPMAGWLSDRTRSRWGRRRPWMLGAAFPLALSFYALWSPPQDLPPALTTVWLGAFLLLYYTAHTGFNIPHFSLGAELSADHHERTRVSAHRVGADVLGMVLAIGCLHAMESTSGDRSTASSASLVVGAAMVVMICITVWFIREPRTPTVQRTPNPLRAFADVARNPHALRLTFAILFAELGLGSIMVAIPYTTDMGAGNVGMAGRMLGFIVLFAISLPVWVAVSKRIGKVRCFVISSAICGVTFLSMGFAVESAPILAALLTAMIGLSQAGMRMFPISLKADIIDWDEAQTNERKEGTYFAAWNLVDKLASGASVAIVGFVIQGANGGIDPEGVKLVVSFIPAAFVCISAMILVGFRLDAKEHARLRAQIDARERNRLRRVAAASFAGVSSEER